MTNPDSNSDRAPRLRGAARRQAARLNAIGKPAATSEPTGSSALEHASTIFNLVKLSFGLAVFIAVVIGVGTAIFGTSGPKDKGSARTAPQEASAPPQPRAVTSASAEDTGAAEGRRYAGDLLARGIPVDRTACAVGMSAGDALHREFNQTEVEAYARAFGNACLGQKVL